MEQSVSALEFHEWLVWLDAEQIGPDWDRLRHAELLAAASNAGNVQRKDGQPFRASDFLPQDPWAEPPKQLPPEQFKQKLAAELAGMEGLFV